VARYQEEPWISGRTPRRRPTLGRRPFVRLEWFIGNRTISEASKRVFEARKVLVRTFDSWQQKSIHSCDRSRRPLGANGSKESLDRRAALRENIVNGSSKLSLDRLDRAAKAVLTYLSTVLKIDNSRSSKPLFKGTSALRDIHSYIDMLTLLIPQMFIFR
jgi:hypothetical protein